MIKLIRNPSTDSNWFSTHLSNMIITGIAAHTAFFAFGGRMFFEELLSGHLVVIPWVAPTIIGVTAIRLSKRFYQKKELIIQ